MSKSIKEGRDAFKTIFEGPGTDPIVKDESNLMQLLMPINSDYSVMGSLITGEKGIYQAKGYAARQYTDIGLNNGATNSFKTNAYLTNNDIPFTREKGHGDRRDENAQKEPTGNLLAARTYDIGQLDTLMHVCKTQSGNSDLCEKTLTQVITNLLYGKSDSNKIISKEMFGGAKPLFFFFLLLNTLCRDTLKNWNNSLKRFPPKSSSSLSKNIEPDNDFLRDVRNALDQISQDWTDITNKSARKIQRAYSSMRLNKIINNLSPESRAFWDSIEAFFNEKSKRIEAIYIIQVAQRLGVSESEVKNSLADSNVPLNALFGGGYVRGVMPRKLNLVDKDSSKYNYVKELTEKMHYVNWLIDLQKTLTQIGLLQSLEYEFNNDGSPPNFIIPVSLTNSGSTVLNRKLEANVFKKRGCDLNAAIKSFAEGENNLGGCTLANVHEISKSINKQFKDNYKSTDISVPENFVELAKQEAKANIFLNFAKSKSLMYQGIDPESWKRGEVRPVVATGISSKDEDAIQAMGEWITSAGYFGNVVRRPDGNIGALKVSQGLLKGFGQETRLSGLDRAIDALIAQVIGDDFIEEPTEDEINDLRKFHDFGESVGSRPDRLESSYAEKLKSIASKVRGRSLRTTSLPQTLPSSSDELRTPPSLTGVGVSKGADLMSGGGGSYVEWFKNAGPNIFYLINALYNLNVKGTKVGGDLFVVENIEEYKANFLSRMNISKDEYNLFDLDRLTSFFDWLNNVIQIVNANREIFDGKKENADIISGPYKAYGITSERSRQRWVGPGSPMAMFGMNGLQVVKTGMQQFGEILTPIPNIIIGGSRDGLKLNDVSFIDVVDSVRGNTNGSEFIGGVMHNNNYEAALLVGKLFSHFENIQSALRARGQKLDDSSVAFMNNALNEIKITVFTAEDTLKNISSWIRTNKSKDARMRGSTINLSQMIKSWSETMRDLRNQSENMADNFYKIEVMVPSMDVNVVY